MRIGRWAALLLWAVASCGGGRVKARPATAVELGPETVVAQPAPAQVRVFPRASSGAAGRGGYVYVIMRGGGPQGYEPLAVAGQVPAAAGVQARVGDWAWVAGRVVRGAVVAGRPALEVHGIGKAGAEQVVPLPLPGPCTGGPAPVLQGDGVAVHGAIGCPVEDRVYLIEWSPDSAGALLKGAMRVREVTGGGAIEVLWHDPDADYLLAGRRLVRIGLDGRQTLGTVPPPGGAGDTRELLRSGDELLVVDGAVGRVIRMESGRLRWRTELRFPVGLHVERMRAVVEYPAGYPGGCLAVVTVEREGPGSTLFGVAVPLDGGRVRDRLVLGTAGAGGLELVLLDGGALLLLQRSGKLVLQRLGI